MSCTPVTAEGDAGQGSGVEAGPDSAFTPDAAVVAADYCALTADFFCDFYLRCGRMAEPDLVSCRQTFLETCVERYQPLYQALEHAGLLRLSSEGLESCQAHLALVPCAHQLLDLEGPCREVWQGLAAVGAGCGLGVESFVCDAQSTCVLDLSFCGHCEPAAGTGEVCGSDRRCRSPELCREQVCVAAAVPGDACGESQSCISGATCTDGTCQARTFAAVGEACGGDVRCPYRSACIGGLCRRSALLGEACGAETACASGVCGESGSCEELRDSGDRCQQGAQCRSTRCLDGVCDGLISACVNVSPTQGPGG